MRTMNMDSRASLPLRVTAVVAVWAPCAVLLGFALKSPLAIAVLTVAVLAVSHVYARFESWSVAEASSGNHDAAVHRNDAGLATVSQADHFLASEFAAARRGRKVSLVMFELEGVTPSPGQAEGGIEADVLREFGRVLSQLTRRMNLSARYGWRSNTFISVLSGADAEAAAIFVQRVREATAVVSMPMPGFSAGIVEYHPDIPDPAQFAEAAQQALEAARASGRAVAVSTGADARQPGRQRYVSAAL
jgi:GGDEF domain-containing protein